MFSFCIRSVSSGNTSSGFSFWILITKTKLLGKSQETVGKKEKEKKRLKKRQDKLEKKKEVKSRGKDGSLEGMMAYVDENGVITDTPPDPTRKKLVFNPEDIQISTQKQEAIDPADLIRKGVLTNFNTSKGFGFIRDGASQDSIFVHINSMDNGIVQGDKVSFIVERGMKGLQASQVKKI